MKVRYGQNEVSVSCDQCEYKNLIKFIMRYHDNSHHGWRPVTAVVSGPGLYLPDHQMILWVDLIKNY